MASFYRACEDAMALMGLGIGYRHIEVHDHCEELL